MRTRQGVTKTCPCGTEFYVPFYRKDTAKFCSTMCLNRGQYKTSTKVCAGCGKEFQVSNSRIRRKFCTFECKHVYTLDEKERRKRNKIFQKLQGRIQGKCLKRNLKKLGRSMQCERCGYNQFEFCLDIHHRDGNCTNSEESNLQVLCALCHRIVERGL